MSCAFTLSAKYRLFPVSAKWQGMTPTKDYAEAFRKTWSKSDEIFSWLENDVLHSKTIDLRLPFVFYLGHLPSFSYIQLYRALPHLFRPINAKLDEIFERGIDPDVDDPTRCHDHSVIPSSWPSRTQVEQYRDEIRRTILDFVGAFPQLSADQLRAEMEFCTRDNGGQLVENDDKYASYMMSRRRILDLVLEHEMMHQETLLYMLQHLPPAVKPSPATSGVFGRGAYHTDAAAVCLVRGGAVTLGRPLSDSQFGWDNEFPAHSTAVADFAIDAAPVSCLQFAAFMRDGGFERSEWWDADDWAWVQRERVCAPATWQRDGDTWRVLTPHGAFSVCDTEAGHWPVYVCLAVARAYTRWRAAREARSVRLPTEAELHRALYPDGAAPAPGSGNYGWRHSGPTPIGTYAPNRWGLLDAVGNGWELSGTEFAGLPGYAPVLATYPGYSRDFFDGKHFVVLGASYGTDAQLVRPSFRNWYQARYPHPHLKFRCVHA